MSNGPAAGEEAVGDGAAARFARELSRHRGCDGRLELMEPADEEAVTVIRCTDCGERIVHRGEALSPSELPDPPSLRGVGPSTREAIETGRPGPSRGGEGHGGGPRAAPGRERDEEVAARPMGFARPPKGVLGALVRLRRARGRLMDLRNRFGLVALLVVVAIAAVVGVMVVIALQEEEGPDGSATVVGAGDVRRELGEVSAVLPAGWSATLDPEGFGEVELSSPQGRARVLASGQPHVRDRDLGALARAASREIVALTEDVIVERVKVGDQRASILASYDEGEFEAVVRIVEGTEVIAIADVGSSANEELAAEAAGVAASVRPSEG